MSVPTVSSGLLAANAQLNAQANAKRRGVPRGQASAGQKIRRPRRSARRWVHRPVTIGSMILHKWMLAEIQPDDGEIEPEDEKPSSVSQPMTRALRSQLNMDLMPEEDQPGKAIRRSEGGTAASDISFKQEQQQEQQHEDGQVHPEQPLKQEQEQQQEQVSQPVGKQDMGINMELEVGQQPTQTPQHHDTHPDKQNTATSDDSRTDPATKDTIMEMLNDTDPSSSPPPDLPLLPPEPSPSPSPSPPLPVTNSDLNLNLNDTAISPTNG